MTPEAAVAEEIELFDVGDKVRVRVELGRTVTTELARLMHNGTLTVQWVSDEPPRPDLHPQLVRVCGVDVSGAFLRKVS